MQVYKLTDQDNKTFNDTKWTINKWKKTDGSGQLCSKGWLHFYYSKELAMFLNPLHADINNPKLWLAEADGVIKDNNGLKGGATKLRIVKQIQAVKPTKEQCIKFAILCAKEVCNDRAWNRWADAWLDGSDRSAESAKSAGDAARAAAEAARAAYWAAWDAWDTAYAAKVAAEIKPIDLIKLAKLAME